MNRWIKKGIPFLVMFLLPLLCVGLSSVGVTSGGLTSGGSEAKKDFLVKTDAQLALDNHWYISTGMKEILTVWLQKNHTDPANREEIPKRLWSYDPETCELKIDLPMPLKPGEWIKVHGVQAFPWKVKLIDWDFSNNQAKGIFVILNHRIGIENEDYDLDLIRSMLLFPENVHPEKDIVSWEYNLKTGGTQGGGNWPKEKLDELNYLTAVARPRIIRRDSATFYSLKKNDAGELEIVEVNPTPAPYTPPVILTRTNNQDQEISKEVGFDVAAPDQTSNGYKLYSKVIYSSAERMSVVKSYKKDNPLAYSTMVVSIVKYKAYTWDSLINKDVSNDPHFIDLKVLEFRGVKVYRYHLYALKNSRKVDGVKPEIITMDTYYWAHGDAIFNLSQVFEDEAKRLEVEQVIEEIIRARK